MYAKLSRSAAGRGQLDKVTSHQGGSHSDEIVLLKHTHTLVLFSRYSHPFFFFFLISICYHFDCIAEHALMGFINLYHPNLF